MDSCRQDCDHSIVVSFTLQNSLLGGYHNILIVIGFLETQKELAMVVVVVFFLF